MENPLAGSDSHRPGGFLTGLGVLGHILDWLTALLELSDEEQEEAGVYLGNQRWS